MKIYEHILTTDKNIHNTHKLLLEWFKKCKWMDSENWFCTIDIYSFILNKNKQAIINPNELLFGAFTCFNRMCKWREYCNNGRHNNSNQKKKKYNKLILIALIFIYWIKWHKNIFSISCMVGMVHTYDKC